MNKLKKELSTHGAHEAEISKLKTRMKELEEMIKKLESDLTLTLTLTLMRGDD